MKLKTILAGLAFVASITLAQAQFSQFSTAGTAVNAGTNWAIIPAEMGAQFNDSQGRPIGPHPNITQLFIHAPVSANNTTLTSYYSTNKTFFTATNQTGLAQTNFVNSTNGFAAGQWTVVHHITTPQLPIFVSDEALFIQAVQQTNQIVFSTSPLQTINPGDQLFQETAGAATTLIQAANEISFTGNGILSGERGKPFLLVTTSSGASTNSIDGVNAQLVP